MASKPVAFLLADVGVTKSHSRPHVPNDNPFRESQFKTRKYRPEFPDRFDSFEDAHQFCTWFFGWYNDEHRHSGIAFHTSADLHYSRAAAIQTQRATVLDAAYTAHLERFVRKPPAASLLRVQGRVVESVDRAADFGDDLRVFAGESFHLALIGVLVPRRPSSAGPRRVHFRRCDHGPFDPGGARSRAPNMGS